MIYKFWIFINLLFITTSFSQNSIGFIDNYAGVNSVEYNPASIVNSFYKKDVNLVSAQVNFGNTFLSVNLPKLLVDYQSHQDINKIVENLDRFFYATYPENKSDFYGIVSVLGLSVSFSLNTNSSIAISTSVKSYANVFDVNTHLYRASISDFISENNVELKTNLLFQLHLWKELGVTYAFNMLPTCKNKLKVGVTLKILKSMYMRNILAKDLLLSLKTNGNTDFFELGGTLENYSPNDTNNFGVGVDIGFVYEIFKKDNPLYHHKIAFSITDLGALFYKNVRKSMSNIQLDFPSLYSFNIKNLNFSTQNNLKRYFKLPSMTRFNYDYNLNNKFFVNFNVDIPLYSKEKKHAIKNISKIDISPRFESKKISVFMPFSLNQLLQFKGGLGIRTKYFFIGSSSLFNHFTNYATEFNLNFGIKIPVYK